MLTKRPMALNGLVVWVGASAVVLVLLGWMLYSMADRGSSAPGSEAKELTVLCAAGIRPAMEPIAKQYEEEYGVKINFQFEGSGTLLSKLKIHQPGDLYLAADESYIKTAKENDLVREAIPLAKQRPVILVSKANEKGIHGIDDLLKKDVRTALGNPEQAAIGKKTKKLLVASGQWEKLEKQVKETGAFLPTVPEIANAVKIGSVDAAIVWDATAAQYPQLTAIQTPELDAGKGDIVIGVVAGSEHPTEALKFARYAGAKDKGLKTFEKSGYEIFEGDVWEEQPKLTFFAGAVNQRALAPIVREFELREGVQVTTTYNGCGILTSTMKGIKDQNTKGGFPDIFMACDVYYLDQVQDWFGRGVNISDTDIVIAVPKSNPGKVESLKDLAKPGLRVTLGEPRQCTIGVLTQHLLKTEGLWDSVKKNIVTQTPSSAMLVPSVIAISADATPAADATLAYKTDCQAEQDKIRIIPVDSPAAKAVQPYSIAKSSQKKQMARRLYETIARSRDKFEAAGFNWRLSQTAIAP